VNLHETYIRRCFELAGKGLGTTAPNPLVGCVIVYDDKIIGEGYHQNYGEAHAEVNAINSVLNKSLLKKSLIYVNLEPCSHFGKTPPCADLIIQSGIPEVVIANTDPYTEVNGKGIIQLKQAGCNVTTGICEEEGRFLNRRFFTFHKSRRPYVILKWAQTRDGFMDIDRCEAGTSKNYWITNRKLKVLVHKWRSEESAVMVGAGTALNDNPQLTTREWPGRNPVRILVDEKNELPPALHLFDGEASTLVFTAHPAGNRPNLEYIQADFGDDVIKQVLNELYKRNIQSVIVEGGKQLLESFLNKNLWDEARVLTGNKYFNKGLKAPVIITHIEETLTVDEDTYHLYINH